MILNNDPELVNYLNCNRYSKLFVGILKLIFIAIIVLIED